MTLTSSMCMARTTGKILSLHERKDWTPGLNWINFSFFYELRRAWVSFFMCPTWQTLTDSDINYKRWSHPGYETFFYITSPQLSTKQPEWLEPQEKLIPTEEKIPDARNWTSASKIGGLSEHLPIGKPVGVFSLSGTIPTHPPIYIYIYSCL